MNSDEMRESISVNLYDENNKSIIRISTESLKMITSIKNAFEDLSKGKYKEFQFQDMKNTRFSGLGALTLRLIVGEREPLKTLKRVKGVSETPVFHWSRTSEGWDECVFWIDGILNSKLPGHQYLTEEKYDDAVIVIAYGEGY